MKKYIFTILTIFLFFASYSFGFANKESYVEKLLDLNYGVEEFKIENFATLENLHFKNNSTKTTFKNFKKVDKLLKEEFMRLYRKGTIDYNSMNALVVNYNNFVYHTNRKFLYERMKELYGNSREVNDAILKNYTLSRSYYIKVKNIVDNSLRK